MVAETSWSIGQLSREVDCKVQTIRYYEQIGLLPAPVRTAGNQRRYGDAHRQRLSFIRHARDLGFPLPAVRALLRLADREEADCAEADRLARQQLAAVRRRIALLQGLQTELERMLEDCSGGDVRDCHVIQTLADHSRCVASDHGETADAVSSV